MGSGGGSQVVYYVPQTSQGGSSGASGGGSGDSGGAAATEAQKVVTPAIAKSIAGDTMRAQDAQTLERSRTYGIASTYLNRKNKGQQSGGNTTLGGN